MLNSVFLKTLRDQLRPIVLWGLGLILLSLMMAAIFPSIQKSAIDFNKYLENLPEAFKTMLNASELNYNTPAGYLNSELFSFMFPLIYLIYAVGLGSGLIGGEESKNTLDMLLANPIPRWRVVLEKFIALVVTTLVIGLIAWEGIALGAWIMKMDLNLLLVFDVNFSASLLAIFFGTLALFISCLKNSRGLATGLTAALAVLSYFMNILTPMVESLKFLRKFSPFYYYNENNPILHGLSMQHVLVFVVAILVFAVAAIFAFRRRDLGT